MTTSEKTLAACLAVSILTNAAIICVAIHYGSSSLNLIIDKIVT